MYHHGKPGTLNFLEGFIKVFFKLKIRYAFFLQEDLGPQGVYFFTVLWADFLEESDQIGFSGLLVGPSVYYIEVYLSCTRPVQTTYMMYTLD